MRIRIRTRNEILRYYVSKIDNLQIFLTLYFTSGASLEDQMVKNSSANAGDMGLIPGLGRYPQEGNGNPLQDSCLENPMDRRATVHGVIMSWTQLSN